MLIAFGILGIANYFVNTNELFKQKKRYLLYHAYARRIPNTHSIYHLVFELSMIGRKLYQP